MPALYTLRSGDSEEGSLLGKVCVERGAPQQADKHSVRCRSSLLGLLGLVALSALVWCAPRGPRAQGPALGHYNDIQSEADADGASLDVGNTSLSYVEEGGACHPSVAGEETKLCKAGFICYVRINPASSPLVGAWGTCRPEAYNDTQVGNESMTPGLNSTLADAQDSAEDGSVDNASSGSTTPAANGSSEN